MKQILTELIASAAKTAFPDATLGKIIFNYPENEVFGDYATPVALSLAKQVGQAPLAVAEAIVAALPSHPSIADVRAVAPGFINITLSTDYYLGRLGEFSVITPVENQEILFEFGQPNTHKVPHIGHLYSYCYGESCVRLLQAAGNTVHRLNYQGDVGLHVAKCLWAYQKNRETDPVTLEEKVAYLQRCYQEGSQAYEEDDSVRQVIDALNGQIYRQDPAIMADWEKTRSWSVAYYQQFEARIGASYNTYYFESQTSQLGTELVRDHVGDVFEDDEGTIIFRGEAYGLHTRVFINRLGNPTYEAKDIGLAALKNRDWQFDRSVITTAIEQNDYWRVVAKAIELVMPEYTGKIMHIGYGLINLTSGKMSSRTGKILTAVALVDMVKERVKEVIVASRDYTSEETERIAELVAIGAIKYSFLRSTAGKNIAFDLESSIAFEGNSGPYLQYTYARIQSVLAKAVDRPVAMTVEYQPNAEELGLLRWLDRFSSVVGEAATNYAPHMVASYLFELAQRYSYFYNQHHILTEEQGTTQFRLALTEAVGDVLHQGLNLLGIEVSDRI